MRDSAGLLHIQNRVRGREEREGESEGEREREKESQGQAVLKRRAQREGKWSRGGEQEAG